MATPIIRVVDLHKAFGDHKVLRGISLEILPKTSSGDHRAQRERQEHLVTLPEPSQPTVQWSNIL